MLIKKIREVIFFPFFSRRDVIVEKVGTVIKMNKKNVLYFLSRNSPSPLHQKGSKKLCVYIFFLENFIFTFILLRVLLATTTTPRKFPSKAFRAAREII